jgi:hypothetical protein
MLVGGGFDEPQYGRRLALGPGTDDALEVGVLNAALAPTRALGMHGQRRERW